jgi:hypothetical protein
VVETETATRDVVARAVAVMAQVGWALAVAAVKGADWGVAMAMAAEEVGAADAMVEVMALEKAKVGSVRAEAVMDLVK